VISKPACDITAGFSEEVITGARRWVEDIVLGQDYQQEWKLAEVTDEGGF
jgi:hypothetical protein